MVQDGHQDHGRDAGAEAAVEEHDAAVEGCDLGTDGGADKAGQGAPLPAVAAGDGTQTGLNLRAPRGAYPSALQRRGLHRPPRHASKSRW